MELDITIALFYKEVFVQLVVREEPQHHHLERMVELQWKSSIETVIQLILFQQVISVLS
jgi:hypothetical protein